MSHLQTDLSRYDNSWYSPQAGLLKRLLWLWVNALVLNSYWLPVNSLKVGLLRLFGAQVGTGVVIKPGVSVKYPWLLSIGNYTWVGEECWIDNLVQVTIGANCCLSQGSMLLTGSHDYKRTTFDLMAKPIVLEDGAWVGAKAIVAPGVTLHSHSVLSAASVATTSLVAYTIYQGNPAISKRSRSITA